jgi:Ca-activated chloride channel family protein
MRPIWLVTRAEDAEVPPRGAGSGLGRRARTRRASIPALIAIAIALSVTLMIGMSARAVINRASCSSRPVLVNLAASDDISPAIQAIARAFNSQKKTVGGRCVQVQVTQGQPSAVAAQIDGQASVQGMTPVDAWIPDSSLWVDVARSFALGAQVVQPTGISVARSPIMIVTSQAVAQHTDVFGTPASWNLLLPSSYGGPPLGLGLSVDIPDPSDSAVGLATLIEVNRALAANPAGRAGFAKFAYSTQSTADFDSVSSLTSLVGSTAPPFDRNALAEASEQAVITYDRANPRQPLAARYPLSANKALGSVELDYPYVLTTSAPEVNQAATAFGRYLLSPYAQSLIRFLGFRSASGIPDQLPASSGLSSQPLELATAASPSEAATNLTGWQKLGLGSRDLVLRDVSPAMNAPVGVGNLTIQDVLNQTSSRGLALFPDTTQMGLWEMPDSQDASNSFRSLVPIGPLPADFGVMSRRQQLQEITATLKPGNNPLRLYEAIVAGYKAMTETYAANYSNALLVLTAGVDSRQDMSLQSALAQIKSLANPAKKIEIVVLVFGNHDFAQLQAIAAETGGAAFPITDASEIGKIFAEAIANRMCDQGCTAP